MEIIQPSVELWKQEDSIKHIARCARVCYASENNTDGIKLCDALWKKRHRSMFRHAGVYYIIPRRVFQANIINKKAFIPSIVKLIEEKYYVSTNEQCAKEYWDELFRKWRISVYSAMEDSNFIKNKMIRITLCLNTSIAISREYNRKSPNNIAEQSTRYVDFIKKVGIKFSHCHWMTNCGTYRTILYKFMLKTTELFYKMARSKYGLNLKPEDARFILPLDTNSKIVYTYTIAEWEYIINMRLWDYTGKAHPDAKILAQKIYDVLCNAGFKIDYYSHYN